MTFSDLGLAPSPVAREEKPKQKFDFASPPGPGTPSNQSNDQSNDQSIGQSIDQPGNSDLHSLSNVQLRSRVRQLERRCRRLEEDLETDDGVVEDASGTNKATQDQEEAKLLAAKLSGKLRGEKSRAERLQRKYVLMYTKYKEALLECHKWKATSEALKRRLDSEPQAPKLAADSLRDPSAAGERGESASPLEMPSHAAAGSAIERAILSPTAEASFDKIRHKLGETTSLSVT